MTDPPGQWRTEADDAWAAERRSNLMAWLRRRFPTLGRVAGAVSLADTGPYAGAPRDPQLRVDNEKTFSTIRQATGKVAYTSTSVAAGRCPDCGQPLVDTHELTHVRDDSTPVSVGSASTCQHCQPDSWLLRSAMPTTSRARDAARRNVV